MVRHLKDENMQHFNSGIGLSISLFPGSIDLRKIDVIQYTSLDTEQMYYWQAQQTRARNSIHTLNHRETMSIQHNY